MNRTALIVNADDFGLTESCTKAIAEAFRLGLISSTTACANGEAIENAYRIANENGFLDRVGIHINLTEGAPLTEGIKNDPFFCESGVFHGKINRLKKPGKKSLQMCCVVNVKLTVLINVRRSKECFVNVFQIGKVALNCSYIAYGNVAVAVYIAEQRLFYSRRGENYIQRHSASAFFDRTAVANHFGIVIHPIAEFRSQYHLRAVGFARLKSALKPAQRAVAFLCVPI